VPNERAECGSRDSCRRLVCWRQTCTVSAADWSSPGYAPLRIAGGGPQQPAASRTTRLQWNANSHAHRHGHSCPSAPAMQHSGGADPTAASAASHELLSSKHKSSSLADTARTAASGVKQQRLTRVRCAGRGLRSLSESCLRAGAGTLGMRTPVASLRQPTTVTFASLISVPLRTEFGISAIASTWAASSSSWARVASPAISTS